MTSLRILQPWSDSLQRQEFFSSPLSPYRLWRPPNFIVNVYMGLFPRSKANYSPRSSVEANNVRGNTSIWRMPSSWMWRCVDLLWTDASEERVTYTFRVEKSAIEEPTWAGGCRLSHQSKTVFSDFSTLKMEAIHSSETSIHTKSTRRRIPEDGILHSHRREHLILTIPPLAYVSSWRECCLSTETTLPLPLPCFH
jgi:hypothetical protein